MELLEDIDKVIILIGKKEKGTSNLHKPIRSIVLSGTNVEEVKKKILEMVKNAKG